MTTGTVIANKTAIVLSALVAVSQLLGSGIQHYQAGRYDQAAEAFTRIIEQKPEHVLADDARYWRGLTYLKLDRKPAALQDFLTLVRGPEVSEYAGLAEDELAAHFADVPEVAALLKETVAREVKRLGTGEVDQRDQAQQRLVRLGEPARPALEQAAKNPDAEVSERAKAVLKELDEQQAVDAIDVTASRVTLKTDSISLEKVFKEIERQTGNAFNLQAIAGVGKKTIACNFDKVPFWEAVDEVCRKGGVYLPTHIHRTGVLFVYPGSSSQQDYPVSSSGCCRVVVQNVTRNYNFQTRQSSLHLSGRIVIEPRLGCQGISPPQFTRLVDGSGAELTVPAEHQDVYMDVSGRGPIWGGGPFMSMRYGGGHWSTTIQHLGGQTTEIAEAEGVVVVSVPATYGVVEVNDIEKAKDKSAGGEPCSVTVRATNRQDAQWTIDVEVKRTYEQRTRSYRGSSDFTFVLVDAEGKEVSTGTMGGYSGHGGERTYTLKGPVNFQVPVEAKPAKLIVRYPDRIVQKKVAFRLEHIPVP